jgi:hypothetical protein
MAGELYVIVIEMMKVNLRCFTCVSNIMPELCIVVIEMLQGDLCC